MHAIHRFLLARRRAEIIAIALTVGVVIGVLDFATGWVLSFAAFYLIPVAICATYAGRRAGLVAGVLSAATWAIANRMAGELLPLPIVVWNSSTRLVFFGVVAWLLASLRATMDRLQEALRREQELSRVDTLTGVRNAQGFREAAALELRRSARYRRPMGLVFIDLDDFKQVNDRLGHAVGDDLLRLVGRELSTTLRQTDTVARLGGDEFALLLPETDRDATTLILQKLHDRLNAELSAQGWRVTASAGAVVLVPEGESLEWLLNEADRLMYAVKGRGKNGILVSEPGVTTA